MTYSIIHRDNLPYLKTLPDNSIDSIVTDPPYGLGKEPDALAMLKDWLDTGHHDVKGSGFMGKEWDAFVPQPALWKECLRVLKPGGHLVAFAGTRTQDLMTLGLRIAGFEIRDCLAWLYGSGFPKSHDVSKALDKEAGAEREVVGRYELPDVADGRRKKSWECTNTTDAGMFGVSGQSLITAPVTDLAKKWEGWGTALKPAYEPCILARKPLIGTVAANVQAHGTGGINIDACRLKHSTINGGNLADNPHLRGAKQRAPSVATGFGVGQAGNQTSQLGRWPANVVLDEVAAELLDRQTGDLGLSAGTEVAGNAHPNGIYGARMKTGAGAIGFGDRGGPSRFFYTAKTSRSERQTSDETIVNNHPTVKPVSLMRWLVKLVTPPEGTVLDPFNGSGSTGVAAVLEGFNYIGVEQEEEYVKISEARLKDAIERAADFNPFEKEPEPEPEAKPLAIDLESFFS